MADANSPLIWEVAALRLTLFLSEKEITEKNTDLWWQSITKALPDKVTQERQKARIKYEGIFDGGKLLLSSQPLRIDWVNETADTNLDNHSKFVTLGNFQNKVEIFYENMLTWLQSDLPPIKRFAFGAILLFPVETSEAGYSKLSQFLPFDIDTKTSSDFLYQINRKRKSQTSTNNLSINRLSKWSVLQLKSAIISTDLQSKSVMNLANAYACHLELDINTDVNFNGELKQNQLTEIFKEVVELGKEIASKGDIP